MASEQAVVSDDTQTSPALKVHMEPRCRLRALLAIQKLHTETSGVLKLVIIARFLISWLYDSKLEAHTPIVARRPVALDVHGQMLSKVMFGLPQPLVLGD
eukprot:scaffold9353_cov136-Isochrysis_galbana.AAC.1